MCPVRTEGYAIVSADGMIADRNCHMPDGLKIPADVRFFNDGLDSASLIVHGAHSHEQQGAVSDRRRRLVVTNGVATIADHPEFPNAKLWNPTGMSFAEVCKAMGVTSGKAAVTGIKKLVDVATLPADEELAPGLGGVFRYRRAPGQRVTGGEAETDDSRDGGRE